MHHIRTSVVIPTRNASGLLPELLRSLKAQSAPPGDIVIVDSSSEDSTAAIAAEYGATLKTIEKEDFDHGATRSLGASIAQGDFIIFLTQDAIPADSRALEKLILPFARDEKIAAVYGRQLPSQGTSMVSAHLRSFNYPEQSCTRTFQDRLSYGIKTIFMSNSFAAYRRTAMDHIGWFRENLIFGEDMHAAGRLLKTGYWTAYASDACVYHSHNYSAREEFKRYFDIGVFHRTENWMLQEFGKAEKEGVRFITSQLSQIARQRQYHIIPAFLIRTVLKYLGYNLGLRYALLPSGCAKTLSMNKNWWNKKLPVNR